MYQKYLCMFGLHIRKWVLTNTVKIVAGNNNQYTEGYVYYYKATCECCGNTKHKSTTV